MEDSDMFLDEPVVTQARAGAKFQPRAKRKTKDETSGSVPCKIPDVTQEKEATLSSPGLDAVSGVQPDNIVDDSKSSQVINPSQVDVTDTVLAEVAVSNCCDDKNSSLGRSVEENADLFFGLECLDQFLTQPSNNNGGIQMDYERTGAQEAGAFPDVDTQDIFSETTITSGRRAGKFKPKPRLQTTVVTSQTDVVEPVIYPPNSQFVPTETMCVENSIPDIPVDDVPDCSPMDLGSFIPPDPSTTTCPMNEELAKLNEASDIGAAFSGDVPGMPKEVSSNIRQRKASAVSRKSKESSTGDEENGNGKATRQLRKQVTGPQIVDDPEDGTCNDDGLAAELPSSSAIDDENDDDDYNLESSISKRRTSTRSKKPVTENGKPPGKRKTANGAQKHKKANEASNQPAEERPKKFSHSTRRKRRFVDDSLLQTPEDEIDFSKVALKDIILLADYKERLAKKEAKTSTIPLTNQSTQQSFHEENAHDEESFIASEQDKGFTDDQESARAQSSSFCLNYQSYMDKEPRTRWSKQDTELFYGAIRQFGPDFSLIQQLFPGRSRHQIKLKYKNEERRSPLKLSEALASRAKDHSYFEKVIEQLQQVSGAEKESHGDGSIDLTHEEEELTPGNNVCFLFFMFLICRIIICGDAMLMREYYGLNMLSSCYVLLMELESMCGILYAFARVCYYKIVKKI
ncbi:hypothetical protein PTKIN_Ptkin14bG0081800 [Pterospermum kingtungense]